LEGGGGWRRSLECSERPLLAASSPNGQKGRGLACFQIHNVWHEIQILVICVHPLRICILIVHVHVHVF
jgi:hypothetical protein